MKGVLISIQKPHTDNIRALLKTIEVRKSVPKLERPFPVFIYETKAKGGSGKVIGEFVCDRVDEWKYLPDCYVEDKDAKIYYINSVDGHATCLTYDEIENYGKGKTLYGWHISNLVIYDKPKSLYMFPVGKIARDCGCGGYIVYDKVLTRPPQSWQYVEVE